MKNLLLLLLLLTGFSTLAGTIKVTNGNDAGPGSLRQAISQAHDGDSIVFTNASGSSSSSRQTIIVNTAPTASISGNASFCAEGSTLLSSNATAGGGTISSYQWQESGNNILGATNATYTAIVAGSYTVVVTNSGGFSTTSTAFAVTVNAVPVASVSGNASFCAGGNTLLSSNATAGSGTISSYQWIRSLATLDINIIGETNATYTASTGGLYEVVVTNSNGCSTQSIPFTVTVNAVPTASISGNASFYAGGNTVLSSNATAGSGTNIIYQWKLGGNNILGATNATYTATAAGSYTVVVTNSHACSTTSTAFAVTVNTATTASISGNASFCAFGSTLLNSNATAGGGTISSYQWQESGNNILGATNATYTATAAGSYTVVVTNSGGFSTTSTAFAVTVNAVPVASVSGNASFCAGGNTLLSSNATAGSGTISSYQWIRSLATLDINIIGETNATYTASTGGLYEVVVTNSNGCSTQSIPFTVTVNAVPTASISGNASFYAGGNTVLSSNATAGSGTNIIYQWKLGGNNILGATNATYTATAAGSYTVVVTNSHACSTTSTAFAVTVNTATTASISGNASFCAFGSTLLNSNATAGGGTISSYQWQESGNNILGATNATYTAIVAGSYTVVVTNSGGFSTTSTAFAVTVNAVPVASVSGNASFCAGGNTLLSSNATAGSGTISSYQWIRSLATLDINIIGETNATYTASTGGLYEVVVTNSNGCSTQSIPFTVTVNAVPTASISGNASFYAGGNTVLSSNATAGSGTNIIYQWKLGGNNILGATNATYTATAAGSYTVVVTNSHACSTTSTAFAVTVNTATTASISGNASFCAFGSTLLNSNATAGGGTISSYQWQESGNNILGATNATYTATAAGSYTVVVTNSGGFSTTSTAFAVTVNAVPVASVSGNASFCAGGNTLLSSNATAGSGTISSYQWIRSLATLDINIIGETNATYTASTGGLYEVVVTNSNGCSTQSIPFTVTVNAVPTASISGNASFYAGGNTVLSSNATAGSGTNIIYQWKLGGNNILGATNATYTATAAGSYTVVVTNSHACSTTSTAFAVTVNAVPVASISGNASFCAEGSTLLSSNATAGGGTISSYQWQESGNNILGATNATYTAIVAGSYTVVVTNSGGFSTTSTAFAVTVNAVPVASVSGNASFCAGGNTLLSSNATAGSGTISSYQWIRSLATLDINIIGETNATYTASTGGLYEVVVTNSNGCSTQSIPFTVTVNAVPTASISGNASFYAGGNTVLSSNATAGSGTNIIYQWKLGGNNILGATNATYTATAAGSYTVVVTNSHACSTTSTAFAVTVNAVPVASISGNASFCAEGSTLLSSNATAGGGTISSYQWQESGNNILGATNATYTAIVAGSYTVVVTNSGGFSTTSTAFAVTVNANPTASVSGNASFCAGGNTLLSSNATAGSGTISSIVWKSNSGIVGEFNATYTALTADIYDVEVTNSNGCSTQSIPFTVTVNAVPTASISGTASFCAGGYTVLNSNATAGSGTINSYQWKLGGNTISGATNVNYTATTAGSYTVVVTNSNGCSFTSAALVVTVNAVPTASISGNASLCAEGSTLLNSNATAGSGTINSYQWKLGGNTISGATNVNYTATTAGTYTVVVTNSNNCSTTSTAFAVTVNANPTASVSGNASFCAGGNTLLSSNATAGSGTISSIVWKSNSGIVGEFNATYTALTADIYDVEVTNSNGCSTQSIPFTVTVNAVPTASISGNASFCAGGNTLLNSNATAGSGTINSYQWKLGVNTISGATNVNYTATAAGSYTVVVTNSNNCSTTSTVLAVTVNALTVISSSPVSQTINALNNAIFSVTATGTSPITYQWQQSTDGGASFNNLSESSVYLGTATNTLNLAVVPISMTGYQYRCMVTGLCGTATSNAAILTVSKRPTVITYTGDNSEQYSDQQTLTALLIDKQSTLVLSGKTVSFSLGTQSVTGITNASGIAGTTLMMYQNVGSYNVISSFAGDATYDISSATNPFNITKENAITDYTGPEFISVPCATCATTSILLSASVKDTTAVYPLNDKYPGDIRKARVKFINLNTGLDISGWLTPGLVSATDTTRGIVSFNWTVTLPSTSYDVYSIGVVVDNNGSAGNYIGSSQTVLSVSRSSLTEFITGGGDVIPTGSNGQYASDAGRKLNFEFNVKYNKSGTNLQGNMNVMFRKGGSLYQIKSTSLSGLSINSTNPCSKKAIFSSKANLTDITNPALPVSIYGGITLQVTMTDNGDPGNTDMIGFTLLNGSSLVYSSNWVSTKTTELILNGGNVVVRNGVNCSSSSIARNAIVNNEGDVTASPISIRAYPNPSRGITTFNYSLPKEMHVNLSVYNSLGQMQVQLVEGRMPAGSHQARFNGSSLAAGIYLYVLRTTDASGNPIVTNGKLVIAR